jgi:hypothetical protein
MILVQVTYELLDHELGQFQTQEAKGWHQLDGQIRLDFSDSPSVFISWVNEPLQHSIGFGPDSHFKPKALRNTMDMKNHPYWSNLVGGNLLISFIEPHHQVVRVASDLAQVFLSSQYDDGMFQGDCVRVSPIQPSYVAV